MPARFSSLSIAETEELIRILEAIRDAREVWFKSFVGALVCRDVDAVQAATSKSKNGFYTVPWRHREDAGILASHPDYDGLIRRLKVLVKTAHKLAARAVSKKSIKAAHFNRFAESDEDFRAFFQEILDEARDILRHTDPLTGLANRFAMLPRLEDEKARLVRDGQPCCVAMVDVDHFKAVNDTHGHQVGDRVLQAMARVMLANIRRYDRVSRYGGEEFLIMLPNTLPERARNVLDRVRRAIAGEVMEADGGTALRITASFGVATLHDDQAVMASVDHADQAMYMAKESGRNRVVVWPDDD